ncbi:MAG: NMD3-related protein [Candidatus Methanofastidiosia archaeon]
MFCYKCGKEEELIGGLCKKCYSEEHALIAPHFKYEIPLCRNCNCFFLDGWRTFETSGEIVEVLVEKKAGKKHVRFIREFEKPSHDFLQVKYIIKHCGDYMDAHIEFLGFPNSFSETAVCEERDFKIFLRHTHCPRCIRMSGGYYEAIFQIRKEGRFLTEDEVGSFMDEVVLLSEKEMETNKMAFITEIKPRKEGIDFQIGSAKFAKKVARILKGRHGGKISESSKLSGFDRQKGKERYRNTVVLRLSQFEVGRFVFFREKLWKIVSSKDKIQLKNFEEILSVDIKKALKDKSAGELKLVDIGKMREGIISSLTKKEAQVMALDNYESVPIDRSAIPVGAKQGCKVLFISSDGRFYFVKP